MNFCVDFGAEDAGRLTPFKDDKPKDTENSPFEASSVLVVKASLNNQHESAQNQNMVTNPRHSRGFSYTEKKNLKQIVSSPLSTPAASYFPGPSPAKYHQLCSA